MARGEDDDDDGDENRELVVCEIFHKANAVWDNSNGSSPTDLATTMSRYFPIPVTFYIICLVGNWRFSWTQRYFIQLPWSHYYDFYDSSLLCLHGRLKKTSHLRKNYYTALNTTRSTRAKCFSVEARIVGNGTSTCYSLLRTLSDARSSSSWLKTTTVLLVGYSYNTSILTFELLGEIVPCYHSPTPENL